MNCCCQGHKFGRQPKAEARSCETRPVQSQAINKEGTTEGQKGARPDQQILGKEYVERDEYLYYGSGGDHTAVRHERENRIRAQQKQRTPENRVEFGKRSQKKKDRATRKQPPRCPFLKAQIGPVHVVYIGPVQLCFKVIHLLRTCFSQRNRLASSKNPRREHPCRPDTPKLPQLRTDNSRQKQFSICFFELRLFLREDSGRPFRSRRWRAHIARLLGLHFTHSFETDSKPAFREGKSSKGVKRG